MPLDLSSIKRYLKILESSISSNNLGLNYSKELIRAQESIDEIETEYYKLAREIERKKN